MKIAVLLITASLTFAQSGPGSPFLGQMIDRERLLRPVYGVGGSFRIGPPVAERVLSASCSLTLCLAKTESAIVSTISETPAPQGDAKIALDNSGATIYFSKTRQFARWQSGTLSPLDIGVDMAVNTAANGTVLSIASRPAGIVLAVASSSGVWITTLDGTILDSLPRDARAALLLSNATIYTTSDSVVIRNSDGSELRFPAPGVTELYAIGGGYVEAVSGDSIYALCTLPGKERLFQLPVPVEEHLTFEERRTIEDHK